LFIVHNSEGGVRCLGGEEFVEFVWTPVSFTPLDRFTYRIMK